MRKGPDENKRPQTCAFPPAGTTCPGDAETLDVSFALTPFPRNGGVSPAAPRRVRGGGGAMPSGESTWSRLRTPFPAADTLLSPDTACTRPTRRSGREQTRTQTEPKKKKRCHGVRARLGMPAGRRRDWGLRVQAVRSQGAGARLQGPLRRLPPLIPPPLAPKNNLLVGLLGALRDRDRLFIPAISMRPCSGRPARPAARLAAQAAGDGPRRGSSPLPRPKSGVPN